AHALRQLAVQVSQVVFNALVHSCGSAWLQAASILAVMPEHQHSQDVVSFNAALAGMSTGGAWPRAVDMMEQLQRQDVEPTSVTLGGTLSALAGDWRLAAHLLCLSELQLLQKSQSSLGAAMMTAKDAWQIPTLWLCWAPQAYRDDRLCRSAATSACELHGAAYGWAHKELAMPSRLP
ncbi:GALC, partial [Symbiodinium pilosum]